MAFILYSASNRIRSTENFEYILQTGLPAPEHKKELTPDNLVVQTKHHPKPLSSSIASGTFTDDQFISVYPFRSNQDAPIRRLRAIDVYRICKDDWTRLEWLWNLDYITVCNIMLGAHIHGERWFSVIKWHTADLDDFTEYTKDLSNRIKNGLCSLETLKMFAECSGLTGYRNPPFPGFDQEVEARKLAKSGVEHPPGWIEQFKYHLEQLIKSQPTPEVPYTTMDEYYNSGVWETSGSSSLGRVFIETPEGLVKIKARKNFVRLTVDDIKRELYMTSMKNKQKNWVLLKAELGKLRIAVAGDFATYTKMARLLNLTGRVYTMWEGNTLEENVHQTVERLKQMQEQLKGRYGLPWDYDAFDHQPTTEEIKLITRSLFELGRPNVPDYAIQEWEEMINDVLTGFDNALIINNDLEIKQTGGLSSGLDITSQVGNIYNRVATSICKSYLETFDVRGIGPEYVRGDDAAIYSDTYWQSISMRLAYAAWGVKGNTNKFGVHREQNEFLRIWMTPNENVGYPNRAIPGLMQRKPWSNNPWTFEHVTINLIDTLRIIERRTKRLFPDIEKQIAIAWSKSRSQSYLWLTVPRSLGGLGILPDQGYKVSSPWPEAVEPAMRVQLTPDSTSKMQLDYSEFNLTSHEAEIVANMRAKALLSFDDIGQIAPMLRAQIKKRIPKNTTFTKREITTEQVTIAARNMSMQDVDSVVGIKSHPLFGRHARYADVFQKASIVSRVRDQKIEDILGPRYEFIFNDIKSISKRLHRSAAIDFVFGKLVDQVSTRLHPMLTSISQKFSSNMLRYCKPHISASVLTLTQRIVTDQLLISPLSTRTMSW